MLPRDEEHPRVGGEDTDTAKVSGLLVGTPRGRRGLLEVLDPRQRGRNTPRRQAALIPPGRDQYRGTHSFAQKPQDQAAADPDCDRITPARARGPRAYCSSFKERESGQSSTQYAA